MIKEGGSIYPPTLLLLTLDVLSELPNEESVQEFARKIKEVLNSIYRFFGNGWGDANAGNILVGELSFRRDDEIIPMTGGFLTSRVVEIGGTN